MQVKTIATENNTMPITLCIFRKEKSILVSRGYDAQKGETFYRPPGGRINFGEYSWATARRQIKEEIGEEIKNLSFLGPLENIFQYEGKDRHEIVFVFEGEFVNKQIYNKEHLTIQRKTDSPLTIEWKPLEDFFRKKDMLYPEGLVNMLRP